MWSRSSEPVIKSESSLHLYAIVESNIGYRLCVVHVLFEVSSLSSSSVTAVNDPLLEGLFDDQWKTVGAKGSIRRIEVMISFWIDRAIQGCNVSQNFLIPFLQPYRYLFSGYLCITGYLKIVRLLPNDDS